MLPRLLFLISLVFCSLSLSAQQRTFGPDDYKVVGIYGDALSPIVHFLIQNINPREPGARNVYTSFSYVTEAGDTLLHPTDAVYRLPQNYGQIYYYSENSNFTSPSPSKGTLFVKSPDFALSYNREEPDESRLLPISIACSNLEVRGVYPNGLRGYELAALVYQRSGRRINNHLGNMTYHLETLEGDPITETSAPSFSPPRSPAFPELYFGHTIDPNYRLTIDFKGYFVTSNPDCRIPIDLSRTFQPEQDQRLLIYPNPSPTTVTVHAEDLRGAYTLLSPTGSVLKKGIIAAENTEMDLSTYPSGILFLQLETEDGQFVVRRIVR